MDAMRQLPSPFGSRRGPDSMTSAGRSQAAGADRSGAHDERSDDAGTTLTRAREGATAVDRSRPSASTPASSPAPDRWLALTAAVAAVLALVVLAGLPSTDSSAGRTVRGIVLLAFWLLAPGGAVV